MWHFGCSAWLTGLILPLIPCFHILITFPEPTPTSRNSTLKIHMQSHTLDKPISDERGFSVCVRLKKAYINLYRRKRCICEEWWVDSKTFRVIKKNISFYFKDFVSLQFSTCSCFGCHAIFLNDFVLAKGFWLFVRDVMKTSVWGTFS